MPGNQYIGLLRGINVGGKNIIRMTDLKMSLENMGYADVATYIQSGNILFSSGEKNKSKLEKLIEKGLSEQFGVNLRLVLVTPAHLGKIINEAPSGFGKEPENYRYDVLFLKEPLTSAEAIKDVSIKVGVDTADAGSGVLYFSRLISKAAQSHLSKIIQLPVYQNLTIRNWNTVTRLLALADIRSKDVK